jgi:hypothetical protein
LASGTIDAASAHGIGSPQYMKVFPLGMLTRDQYGIVFWKVMDVVSPLYGYPVMLHCDSCQLPRASG